MSRMDHQENWWGLQRCRRCNPQGVEGRPHNHRPFCPDCDGSGWTEWAALATEPWTEIIPNLWVGGHDYNTAKAGTKQHIVSRSPQGLFDTVISMYGRQGFAPSAGVEHHEYLFPDGALTASVVEMVNQAAQKTAAAVQEGRKTLVRCQAGLNRSSLVAAAAMGLLGFSSMDAMQLIRAKRSPWALCNDHFEQFLLGGQKEDVVGVENAS